jgi:hypothetical protein
MKREMERKRKRPPAAGGDNPPRTPLMGERGKVLLWETA